VFGEIAIGVALILGLASRFASYAAVLMMAMFYIANWSFGNGPFNEQFMYGITALVLAVVGAGEYYGLDAIVDRSEVVKRTPILRYVLA
jgi:thiosulfate dehydrogenase [quinone] large subunit